MDKLKTLECKGNFFFFGWRTKSNDGFSFFCFPLVLRSLNPKFLGCEEEKKKKNEDRWGPDIEDSKLFLSATSD